MGCTGLPVDIPLPPPFFFFFFNSRAKVACYQGCVSPGPDSRVLRPRGRQSSDPRTRFRRVGRVLQHQRVSQRRRESPVVVHGAPQCDREEQALGDRARSHRLHVNGRRYPHRVAEVSPSRVLPSLTNDRSLTSATLLLLLLLLFSMTCKCRSPVSCGRVTGSDIDIFQGGGMQGFQQPIAKDSFIVDGIGALGNTRTERGLTYVEVALSGHM